ncbi:GMC family oxidoreductase [Sphingomonas sp. PL-96]|uniref:GMC oxidoreductase n=1 Tax=Sphingomonas sp. PL-96 TaxID=2887201 RepID=UPI001E5105CD|nr:GMC family oxidoreductase [Sphingomonas sp. PL-96]MCC2976469.1 GMC family oxidoreductase [Sphingomonas sp. PL-96]
MLLLESGGEGIEREVEQLNANATVTGLDYPLQASRLRYIGGTTNHWSGHCYRFLDRDFAPRPGIANTGWPIGLADVAGYLPEASKRVLFRDDLVDWSPERWRHRLGTKGWPLDPELFETRLTFVAPINPQTGNRTFARYAPPVTKAPNIRFLHHANVTELVGSAEGTRIEEATVRTLAGTETSVRARLFVLAAGGVENARVLLASRRPFATGLGNGHDQVGRYFTDHVVIYQDFARNPAVAMDRLMAFQDYPDGTHTVSHFLLTDAALRREGIDDVFLRVTPVYDPLTAGGAAAKGIQDSLAQGSAGSIRAEDLSTAIGHPVDTAGWAVDRGYCRAEPTLYRVAARLEPRPVADSRVTLTDRRDAVGMPILNLHWTLAEEGKRSLHRSLLLFGQEAGRRGLGRLRLSYDPKASWPTFPELDIGYHHTGTTRMSADPRQGVVDRNCRVHGVGNVYVAGSSVFPTAGSGSPTMMLTALALRLADHIKQEHFA